MPTDFSGTWVSARSEGWKELLELMQVPLDKLSKDLKVTETITQSGDNITILTTNSMDAERKRETKFTVGSNFTNHMMGRDVESTTAWDGDKLVTKGVGGRSSTTREIVNGEMLFTVTAMELTAKSYFTKQ